MGATIRRSAATLAQIVTAAADVDAANRVEKVGLQVVDGDVELLDGAVVAVDDGVEEPVQQEADCIGRGDQLGVQIPLADQHVDIELVLSSTPGTYMFANR